MNQTTINKAAEQLKVIAHPTRLQILLLLASQGPLNVTAIQQQVGIEQSLLSHHLIKLKDRGILICQRKGKEMHYQVTDSFAERLLALFSDWNKPEMVVR